MADLALLALAIVDLHRGAVASQAHGLAALYLGFTVAFGHSMVRWADRRFAHRFARGRPPTKPPRTGPARVEREWHEFGKAALAWAVSGAILLGLTAVAGNADSAQMLLGSLAIVTVVLVIWFLTGPLGAIVATKRASASAGPVERAPHLNAGKCS